MPDAADGLGPTNFGNLAKRSTAPAIPTRRLRVRAASLNYHAAFTCRGMPGIRIPMPAIMKQTMAILLMLGVLSGLVAPALAQTIGIVLMHGKTGSPSTVIDRLATALQSAGYLVDTPEMCWSQRRIYDRPFL